jgi:uncharacterized protein YgiB involved in biofilm formation
MKKSRSIRLVLLGTASAAVLTACGDSGAPPKDARYFANAQECSATYDDQACRDAKAAADQAHVAQAPRYSRKEECEAQYGVGHCETRETGSGSFFMPLLMGYMMGNMLGGPRYAQPVYRDRDDNAVTPGRGGGGAYRVGSFSGTGAGTATTGTRAAFRPAPQVTQISRGGFGSSASRYSSSAGG